MDNVTVFDHPVITHKLTILRNKETGSKDFRDLVSEIAMLMAYEVTRDLELEDVEIETPLAKMTGKVLAGKKLGIVPILRAGLGMVDGMLNILPAARVGHVGLYRDPETFKPVEYYCKLPADIAERDILVLDPMLATGGSAIAALDFLKEKGCKSMKMVSILAARQGVEAMHEAHPDVPIYVAGLDEILTENAYILPGLGDAGDRLFGTK
ncbi:MAG: uracil phosphoribosyltransferase [Tissierellia bacterium]|nr:uracil phosphoribosyltransferase [Tissierellia bacterium]